MDDSEVTATILFLLLLLLLVIFYGFSQGIRQLNAKDLEKDFEKTSKFKKSIINGLMNEQTRLFESTQFIITNITLFMGWHYIPLIQLSLQNTLDNLCCFNFCILYIKKISIKISNNLGENTCLSSLFH